jgi:hypothetical protein
VEARACRPIILDPIGPGPANPIGDRNIPVAGSLSHLGPLIEDSPTTRSRTVSEPPVT